MILDIITNLKNSFEQEPIVLSIDEAASKDIINKFNDMKLGVDAFIERTNLSDESLKSYLKTVESGNATFDGYNKYVNKTNALISLTGVKAKATAIGVGLLNTALSMGISLLAGFIISEVIKGIDNYIHRLENAKEALENTELELESVDSELLSVKEKIKELNSMDNLSITDEEELQRLRDENEELRIRKKYLEDQAKYEREKVEEETKKKYNKKYSTETSRENIDAYKNTLYSKWDEGGTDENGNVYYKDVNDEYLANYINYDSQYENDSLSQLIATLEHLREERQKAITAGDIKAVDNYNKQISETEASLRDEGSALLEFKDDLKEGSEEYNSAAKKIELINQALYSPGQNLVKFIDNDITDESKNDLVQLAEEGKLTSDVLSSKFSEVDLYLKENGLTLEDLISILVEYKEELSDIPTGSLDNSKSAMIDLINSMSDGFDILDKIYADIYDGDNFDFTNLDSSKFEDAFNGLKDEYTNFIETVSASPTDINACQDAFNQLTTAFIKQKGILENVTQENKQLTIDMLENMGVVNAEEVVLNQLAQQERILAIETEKASLATKELAMDSWDSINALMNQEGASEVARIAMAQLALEKMHVNNIKISTSEDIQQIINLANTALAGTEALAKLASAKQVLGAVERADGDLEAAGVANWEYYDALRVVEELNNGTYEFKFNLIETADFITQYGGASETAAAKQEKLADATKSATDALEKQLEVLKEQKEEMDSLLEAIDWFFDKKIEKIDDSIEKINEETEALEKQQDTFNLILSAVDNYYDKRKQALQDEIDKLRDANDEEEKALQLEKAKAALKEAQSRKTLMVYKKGVGFTYEVNQKSISEAQEELEDLQDDEVVSRLEEQIELLEKAQEEWANIPDIYNEVQEEIAAKKYFGMDLDELFSGKYNTDEIRQKLQDAYYNTQAGINSNELEIENLEKQKAYYEEQKKLWSEAANEYKYSQYEAQLASFFGSDYEYQLLNNSASWRRKFADEYSNICAQIEALEERIKASNESTASSTEASAEKVAGAAGKVKEATKDIKFEIDTNALKAAQDEFDQLSYWIDQGKTGFIGARDALAVFLQEYPKLNGATEASEELKNSVSNLQSIYENTGRSFGTVIDGVDGSITDFEVKSRTLKDNLTEVDTKMQSIANSESQVESTVDTELSNTEQTISKLITKLDDLKLKLGEIKVSTDEAETIVDEELLNTSTVVDGIHTKVGEIQSAISLLQQAISPLEGSLDILLQKLSEVDKVTLSGIIGAFGGATGGGESEVSKESGEKSSSKGEGSEFSGTGLLSAVKAVDKAIGSVDDEESLLGKLAKVDASTLENIIAQFGLSSDNGDSEGENLLSAVNAVSKAILGGGKDDESSLIASIEQLGSDPTIEHVTTVSDSFQTLHDTIKECIDKVKELSEAIKNIPSSNASVNVNGHKATGTAHTFGTGTANNVQSGNAYAKGTGKWGLKSDQPNSLISEIAPEILLRDGQYYLIEDPTIMDLEKDDIVFNHKQTEEILKNGKKSVIDKLSNQSKSIYSKLTGNAFAEGTMKHRIFDAIMNGLSIGNTNSTEMLSYVVPMQHIPEFTGNNGITLTIGDIYLNGVQDPNGLAKAIKDKLPRIMVQELNKR